MLDIEKIWKRIKVYANGTDIFYTKTGMPFTFTIIGDVLRVNRTDRALYKSNFEKALPYMPLEGPGIINNIVQGPAYVYGILMDKRITNIL